MSAPLTRSSHSWRCAWFATALIAATACGGGLRPEIDAAPSADAAVDSAIDVDAAIDPDAAPAGPTRVEIVGGSARLTGGAYAVDLAIGVPGDPAAVSGGTTAVQSGTPVHP